MERKHEFLRECICYIIIVGWVFWCLNKQIKLMRIDFSAVTVENTAAVVEYDCISMKGSFFYFPIYEMKLDGKTYRHKSFLFEEKREIFARTAIRYNLSNPSEFYSVEEIELRDRMLHLYWMFIIFPGFAATYSAGVTMGNILLKHTELRYHYE